MHFSKEISIFKIIRKYEKDKIELSNEIIKIFHQNPNRTHINLLKHIEFLCIFRKDIFIFEDYIFMEKLLTLNIELLSYCYEKNYDIYKYIDINNIISNENNIKIIRNKLMDSNMDFVNLMYLIHDDYKKKILHKNKYIFRLIHLSETKSSHIWIKYIDNLDIFLNSINSKNIFNILHAIFYDRKISLSIKQKEIIIFKIYKYLFWNEKCITFIEFIFDKKSSEYKEFILKCSKKSIYIWEFIPLDDYFFKKIIKNINCKKIIDYNDNMINNVSQSNLINNIRINPDFIYFIDLDEHILLNIININSDDLDVLDFIINEVAGNFETQHLLTRYSIISRLLSINTCYFMDTPYDFINNNLDLDSLCSVVKHATCACVMDLHCIQNVRDNISRSNSNTILKLVEANPIILSYFNKNELLKIHGDSFIQKCIVIDYNTISFFKDIIPYENVIHYNPLILEAIQSFDSIAFKTLFKWAITSINRNYKIFVSDATYEKYFLDVCNANILFNRIELVSCIRSCIYQFLI